MVTSKWIIRGPCNPPVWWNNKTGWGDYASATRFDTNQAIKVTLPMGGGWQRDNGKKQIWTVSYSLVKIPSGFVDTDKDGFVVVDDSPRNENATAWAQKVATARCRKITTLEFEDYSDEIHCFYYRDGHRRRFLNLQLEGYTDE